MSLSKKIDLLRDFAAGVLYDGGPLPSYDPISPPYPLCTCIQYTYTKQVSEEEEKLSCSLYSRKGWGLAE